MIESQCMIIWFLSHSRTTKAQASLCKCADSPHPLLLAYTKYGCSEDPEQFSDTLPHVIRQRGRFNGSVAHLRSVPIYHAATLNVTKLHFNYFIAMFRIITIYNPIWTDI